MDNNIIRKNIEDYLKNDLSTTITTNECNESNWHQYSVDGVKGKIFANWKLQFKKADGELATLYILFYNIDVRIDVTNENVFFKPEKVNKRWVPIETGFNSYHHYWKKSIEEIDKNSYYFFIVKTFNYVNDKKVFYNYVRKYRVCCTNQEYWKETIDMIHESKI